MTPRPVIRTALLVLLPIALTLATFFAVRAVDPRTAPSVAPSPHAARLGCTVRWLTGADPFRVIYLVYPVVPPAHAAPRPGVSPALTRAPAHLRARVTLVMRQTGGEPIVFPVHPVVTVSTRAYAGVWRRAPALDVGASAVPDSCTAVVLAR